MASAALRSASFSAILLMGCAGGLHPGAGSSQKGAAAPSESESVHDALGEIRYLSKILDSAHVPEWEIVPAKAGELSVVLYDEFGEEVFASRQKADPEAAMRFSWNGNLPDLKRAPAGAYYLKAWLLSGHDTLTYDPRWTTGGEVVNAEGISTQSLDGGIFEVSFEIKAPSLLNVYFGLLGGVTFHQPLFLKAYPKGKHLFRWRAKDNPDSLDYGEFRNLIHGVSGYALPENAFVVSTGPAADFRARPSQTPPLARLLRPVATQARFPVSEMVPPEFSLVIANPKGRTPDGLTEVSGKVQVRVLMKEADRLRITRQRFETMFFSDLFGIFEDEDASLPFTFEWDVSGYNPGKHVLTCNITTYALAHAARTLVVVVVVGKDKDGK